MIVAVVMVLQRLEGCCDREAVDRFAFDARWKYAAGGLDFDYPGFAHTVLVDMRARLARSERPDRIFEVTLEAARQAGLVGRRRVLDSTPLYDAVATMDTVTLVRSAIRGLLRAAGGELAGELRACCTATTTTRRAGKPACDWDDAAAREELVDALARDACAVLAVLEGRELEPALAQAAALLATVIGQDLEQDADRGVPDRPAGREGPGDLHRRSRMRGTGTRPPPAGSTAIRGTSRSTRTRRSSPPPRPRRATAATPRPPRACSRDLLPGDHDGAAGGDRGQAAALRRARAGGLRRCRLRLRRAAGAPGRRRRL